MVPKHAGQAARAKRVPQCSQRVDSLLTEAPHMGQFNAPTAMFPILQAVGAMRNLKQPFLFGGTGPGILACGVRRGPGWPAFSPQSIRVGRRTEIAVTSPAFGVPARME
jgi:hypothetical protein